MNVAGRKDELQSRPTQPPAMGPAETNPIPLIAQLQRQAGNAAVASLLSRLPPGSGSTAMLQSSRISDVSAIRAQSTAPATIEDRPKQDLRPETIVQRAAVDERGPEGVVEDLREAVKLVRPVHLVAVNFDAAAAVLADLTPSQGKQVDDLWLRKVDHPLRPLLAGDDNDFPNTNLRRDQFKALANLLRGTRADVSEGFMAPAKAWKNQAEAEEHRLVVQAAKLHDGLRQGESGKEAAFAALATLGGGPDRIVLLEKVYIQHFQTSAMIDLTSHLSGLDLQRAIALFTGDHAGAEAIAIDKNLEVKRRSQQDSQTLVGMARAIAQERKADAAIEEHLANLRAAGGSEAVKKALERKSGERTIGAGLDALAHDDNASVRKALQENDDSRLAAARLARLQKQGKLTAGDLERELTDLRDAIRRQVIAELVQRTGSAPPDEQHRLLMVRLPAAFFELEAVFQSETHQSLRHVVSITGSDGPRVAGMGNIELPPGVEQERNLELLRGFGTFVEEDRTVFGMKVGHISAAVKELDIAVREKDIKRIRKALAGRTKTQVIKLADEYKSQTGRELHADLLGSPEMEKVYRSVPWLDKEAQAEKGELLEGDKFEPSDPWEMDPKRLLVEEASWIYHRLDALYKRVIENRGLFAEARDWVGNLERTLVDDARHDADAAWSALFNHQRVSSMRVQLAILKRCQARLEHNVDRYKEATREAFDTFVEIAVFAVTTALTLGEGGAAIMALRGIVGTVGTKLVLKGDDYSLAEFRNDVLGGAAGALGGHAATKAFEELMPSLTAAAAKEAGMTVPGHIASFAKESSKFYANQLASTNATALATGQSGGLVGFSELAQGVVGHVAGGAYKATKRGGSSTEAIHSPETEQVPSGSPGATREEAGRSKTALTPERPPTPAFLETGNPGAPRPDAPTGVSAGTAKPKVPHAVDVNQIHEFPEDTVMQAHGLEARDPAVALQMYRNLMKESPAREAGVYRNTVTGEYIVIQGAEGTVSVGGGQSPASAGAPQRWKEVLNQHSDVGEWHLQAHSHPVDPTTGMVAAPNRLPSGAEGDFGVMYHEALSATQPRSSEIAFVTERGLDHTYFGYDPTSKKPYWIEYPKGPVRIRLEFKSIADYHAWFRKRFGVDLGNVPPHMATRSPVGVASPQATTPHSTTATWESLEETASRPTPRQETGGFRSQPVRVGDRSVIVIDGVVGEQISQAETSAGYTPTLSGEHATHAVGMQIGENLPEGITSGPGADLNLSLLKTVENATRQTFDIAIQFGATVETKTTLRVEHRVVGGNEVPVLVGVKREASVRVPGTDHFFKFIDFEAHIDRGNRIVTGVRNVVIRPPRSRRP